MTINHQRITHQPSHAASAIDHLEVVLGHKRRWSCGFSMNMRFINCVDSILTNAMSLLSPSNSPRFFASRGHVAS